MPGYFIPLIGKLDKNKIKSIYKSISPDEDPEELLKKTVFIFPGNSSHHPPKLSATSFEKRLYARKTGGGLAHVADELSSEGYPTLSLPTTGMEAYDPKHDDAIKKMIEGAIADIRTAIKAGFNVALPVRIKDTFAVPDAYKDISEDYFKEPLFSFHAKDYEPSFWGANQPEPNPKLAEYYLTELKEIQSVLKRIVIDRDI